MHQVEAIALKQCLVNTFYVHFMPSKPVNAKKQVLQKKGLLFWLIVGPDTLTVT